MTLRRGFATPTESQVTDFTQLHFGAASKTLQAILEKAAPPELELAFRPMFGGIMGYAAGKVFASLSDVGLALKLSGENHTALLAIEGSKPLQYEPDQPTSKSYVVVPEAMLENAEQLRDWVVRSASGLTPKSERRRKEY